MRYILPYLFFFSCVLFSCNLAGNKAAKTTTLQKSLIKIDSLLQYEKNNAARTISFEMLESIPKDDNFKKSCLYGYIGQSYLYSFHFDSAVYYTKTAYELSSKLNDKRFQAEQAAHLLKVYCKSDIYIAERRKLFDIVNNVNIKALNESTQVLILDALAEYYFESKRYQMSLYISTRELNLLKTRLSNQIASHADSLNMAHCYIHLCDPYLWKSYFYSDNIEVYAEQANIEKGMRNLLYAKEWMGNNSYLLAKYYTRAAYLYSINSKDNMSRTVAIRDSLVDLAEKTGHNFNGYIVQSNVLISDIYFYFLAKVQKKSDSSWKYYNDAVKYDSNLINPVVSGYLQWLKGDLLLRDQKYDSALSTFRGMSHLANMFTLKQLISYYASIAKCHKKLGDIDSMLFYHNLYISYTDSLIVVNEKEIIADIESEYRYKLAQDKISIKNLTIENAYKQRIWLFTCASTFLCLSVLLIIFYKNKRRSAIKLNKQNATLKHLNQQLKEANQTKAKLFAIIGHDFRSPISQIYQLLKLQQSQTKLIKAEEKETLETQIRTATSSLLDSMEDLLIWSKSQMQLFNIIKEPVDLSELCKQCINLLKNVIRDKQLHINLDMAPDTILETDTNFLLAILRNIIHNAIKASPEKGRIIICFERTKNRKILKVINKGALFTQQNYLEALHQTQTSKLLTGGLGLMIIDELSKQIGAEVSFETINDNETCCKLQFSS